MSQAELLAKAVELAKEQMSSKDASQEAARKEAETAMSDAIEELEDE
ncbi:MAG: hypothetical protein ACTSO7_03665 [Candidatus Heimdallarchaeota archaeon]